MHCLAWILCFHLSVLINGESRTCPNEDAALIQVRSPHHQNASGMQQEIQGLSNKSLEIWESPRDLTTLSSQWIGAGELQLQVFSAIPSFGEHGNFIALLVHGTAHTGMLKLLDSETLFCSGPNRSHLTQLRIKSRSLLCDWPKEESGQESFEVFLEDAQARSLGSVLARQKPGLLAKYGTVACVQKVNPAKQLMEWLEFNILHGVDHFFIYTFKEVNDVARAALLPYLSSGLATRIHFTEHPEPLIMRTRQVMNDCLFRAKSHATWVLPSVDMDEYFRLNSGAMFAAGKVPQDYLKTTWDAILTSHKKELHQIHSISFERFRFNRIADPGRLEIASVYREPDIQVKRQIGGPKAGKSARKRFVCNVNATYEVKFHFVTSAEPNTEDLLIPESLAVFNHYRSQHPAYPNATMLDKQLFLEVPVLQNAIEKRFGERYQDLVVELYENVTPLIDEHM